MLAALKRWGLPRIVRLTCKLVLLAAALWLAVAAGFAAQSWWRLADLSPWHRIVLENEFHASRTDAPKTFVEYLALEERLFAELRQRIYATPGNADTYAFGRYTPGSVVARLALDAPQATARAKSGQARRVAPCCCCMDCPTRRIRCMRWAVSSASAASTW